MSRTRDRNTQLRVIWSLRSFRKFESSKGMLAFNIMKRIIPRDQTSDSFGLYGVPFTTSGAAYAAEPQYVWLSTLLPSVSMQKRAKPKSASFTLNLRDSRMFSHFKSRCAMFLLCRYCNPLAICRNHSFACCSGTTPLRFIKSSKSPLSAYLQQLKRKTESKSQVRSKLNRNM